MYPKMCELIKKFSDLCIPRGAVKGADNNEDVDDDNATTNQTTLFSSSDNEDHNSSEANAYDESAKEKGEQDETNFLFFLEMKSKVMRMADANL